MKTIFRNIPAELRARPQWCVWANRDGRKIPFTPDGTPARANESLTWSPFPRVLEKLVCEPADLAGPGFIFSHADPFCGVDLDGIRDPQTGRILSWAREWILKLDSYSEVSPSGCGVKIIVRAKSPFASGKKCQAASPSLHLGSLVGVEIYDHLRFFAITGQKLKGVSASCEDRQNQIQAFCSRFFSEKRPKEQRASLPEDRKARRITKYLESLEPAVSGCGGHDKTFHAACSLILGFNLTPEEAFPFLATWNRNCSPPWSDRELWHKLRQADEKVTERGYLL